MGIREINGKKETLLYGVFCDKCGNGSNCTNEDPGNLALKAKQEKFVTVPGREVFDPMTWNCGSCAS